MALSRPHRHTHTRRFSPKEVELVLEATKKWLTLKLTSSWLWSPLIFTFVVRLWKSWKSCFAATTTITAGDFFYSIAILRIFISDYHIGKKFLVIAHNSLVLSQGSCPLECPWTCCDLWLVSRAGKPLRIVSLAAHFWAAERIRSSYPGRYPRSRSVLAKCKLVCDSRLHSIRNVSDDDAHSWRCAAFLNVWICLWLIKLNLPVSFNFEHMLGPVQTQSWWFLRYKLSFNINKTFWTIVVCHVD